MCDSTFPAAVLPHAEGLGGVQVGVCGTGSLPTCWSHRCHPHDPARQAGICPEGICLVPT